MLRLFLVLLLGAEGGTQSGRSRLRLAKRASDNGQRFRQTIRNPALEAPGAGMPAQADYDDATQDALNACFKSFAAKGRNR